jgi:hypothetical protein
MHFVKVLAVILCALALAAVLKSTATAEEKNLGIHDVSRITFYSPVRLGTALLPAGDYIVRHTMQGQDHIMVFQAVRGKTPEVKVKCTLVPLAEKAPRTETIYQVNAANEKVLQELVFRGDTAKHVF